MKRVDYGVSWVLRMSRCISNIRQSSKKNGWKTKSCTKNEEKPGSRGARSCVSSARPCVPPTTVHGVLHGQTVVGSVPLGPPPLELCVLASLVLRFWPRNLPMLGYFGLPLLSSLIHMALNFTLSPITWLISQESTIKTRKSRNKRNWRNRGINHINIH